MDGVKVVAHNSSRLAKQTNDIRAALDGMAMLTERADQKPLTSRAGRRK
jgi:hypothetical protein